MFGRIASRLLLQFRRKALITRRFYQECYVRPYKSYMVPVDYNVGLSRTWAQATRSFGKYVIKEKELLTHKNLLAPKKSKLWGKRVVRTIDGKKKKRFTREEAIQILKELEKSFQQQGYVVMPEQPFSRRIYFNREAKEEKRKTKREDRAAKRVVRAAAAAAKNSPPAL